MRKKYHTLEEVRAAAAERQRKWREDNKVLARERVAYVYGKAKYPQMVEERQRKRGQEASIVTNAPSITHKEIEKPFEDPSYVDVDSVEGDAKVMAAHAAAIRKRRPPPAPRQMEPKPKGGQTENELATYERLVEMTQKKKAERGIPVELDL